MYPLCRREHKTLGQRSPVTNVPMILQSYSWREAIASILFPESVRAPWSEAEQPGAGEHGASAACLASLALAAPAPEGFSCASWLAWKTTGHSKGSKEGANGVQSRARAPAYHYHGMPDHSWGPNVC
jgi:hypothetical protein